jgi:hypothetical protein
MALFAGVLPLSIGSPIADRNAIYGNRAFGGHIERRHVKASKCQWWLVLTICAID